MNLLLGKSLLFALVVLFGIVDPVAAVIKADLPLSKIFEDSDDIIIAKIDVVNVEKNGASLKEAVAFSELKSGLKPRDRSLILHLDRDKVLAGRLKMGDPVVLFVAKKSGAAHIDGSWFTADSPAGPNWRLIEKQDLGRNFPGTTPSLIRALMELRADKAPLLNAVMHHTWTDGGYKVQKLDAAGSVMASADANGDRKADLLVIFKKGIHFYEGTGPRSPFIDATDKVGLSNVTGRQIAFGDIDGDGKPDLLLDELFLNKAGKFVRSKSGINLKDQDVLAVALMDATGDGKPDAIVLTRDGELTVFENPGSDMAWPRKWQKKIWKDSQPRFAAHIGPWGDDGKPHVMAIQRNGPVRYSMDGETADFQRLTGQPEPMFRGKPRHFPFDDFRASVAWDRNGGDGHLDLLVATARGGVHDVELIGRGHGAFFYNTEGRVAVHMKGKRAYTPKVLALAPADIDGSGAHSMLILEENGDLWVNPSPFYSRGSPLGVQKK